jgi:DNA-binding XRE family transcriptional regulator
MTSNEIAKVIGKRVKTVRKKQFSSQKIFAQHIGMPEETYARFERTGLISFTGLISVARGLENLEEIIELFAKKKEVIQW